MIVQGDVELKSRAHGQFENLVTLEKYQHLAYRKSEYFAAEAWGTEHESQDFSEVRRMLLGTLPDYFLVLY